ncbi:MAG: PEP/pyruvate-binding domain-containing protein [Bacteroidales bacterium]|jgi:predicted nucleotidyltransferase|nr:PEP/pyruvate-binding domain-containing protein [Bacteroidales bacterium]
MNEKKPLDDLIGELKERAKELNCLYQVQELLNNPENSIEDICTGLVDTIPPGWQYPDICRAKIQLFSKTYMPEDLVETNWVQKSDILIQNEIVGHLFVYYLEETPAMDEGPFLKDERKLIDTIAERLGLHLLHLQLKNVFDKQNQTDTAQKKEWEVILDMLKQTNPKLLIRLSRKMVNYLCWTGVKKAEELLEHFGSAFYEEGELIDENKPFKKSTDSELISLSYRIFEIAEDNLSLGKILNNIQKWTKEDRSGFLSKVLENMGSSLQDINNAIERYHHLAPQMLELSEAREKGLRVAMIRRILTDQADYIDIAKRFVDVNSFNALMNKIISPVGSHGKLGGKSAGLFLAHQMINKYIPDYESFTEIKVPKTWYITSDGLLSFMDYNNLEEVMEQKYKDIGQIRQEYPYVIQLFKNSTFPPSIVKGLLMALDDFGSVPLIIRSSSLLEDRIGMAFAGKYKSLFIANQGTKEERLVALMDAIAEIYASVFGPDPIDYRAENDLLDYHEEMGIMIQQVVGTKVGHYHLPAFAGVAFSQNEFRWSPRITRKDGLIRLVPGLGTRAVDRISNDYPILIAPGQPQLKVNVTVDEVIKYSPKYLDVINLESGAFETVELEDIKQFGKEYPIIHQVVSRMKQDFLQLASPLTIDFQKDFLVVTFEGLISRTKFVQQTKDVLEILSKEYNNPVDIEFAHDGSNLYLLQCRTQSAGIEYKPAVIPSNVSAEKSIFSANKHISNGIVTDITHIVYVDPKKYSEVSDYETLKEVGRSVGRLNKILPKRQFILMGPGRWGSRGDIKLGVSVTYSEINNTTMLIEIAKKTNEYTTDLSFGTHFFQDLVESNIRYLPLYPDEAGTIFNEQFLKDAENVLSSFLPDMKKLEDVIHVIDVPASADGQVLNVLMNGETNKALAILSDPSDYMDEEAKELQLGLRSGVIQEDVHWQWRLRNVEKLAAQLDPERFGVKGFYLFGSVKNAHAGPSSDIDILIHFTGSDEQRKELRSWLEGWSLCLSQINFLRTGNKTEGLLDIHIVTDEDIKKRDSFAIKIGAVSDAARPLPMGTALKKNGLK